MSKTKKLEEALGPIENVLAAMREIGDSSADAKIVTGLLIGAKLSIIYARDVIAATTPCPVRRVGPRELLSLLAEQERTNGS